MNTLTFSMSCSLASSSVFLCFSAYNFWLWPLYASRSFKDLNTVASHTSTWASQTIEVSISPASTRLFALNYRISSTTLITTSYQDSSSHLYSIHQRRIFATCAATHIQHHSLSPCLLSTIKYRRVFSTKVDHTRQRRNDHTVQHHGTVHMLSRRY